MGRGPPRWGPLPPSYARAGHKELMTGIATPSAYEALHEALHEAVM